MSWLTGKEMFCGTIMGNGRNEVTASGRTRSVLRKDLLLVPLFSNVLPATPGLHQSIDNNTQGSEPHKEHIAIADPVDVLLAAEAIEAVDVATDKYFGM